MGVRLPDSPKCGLCFESGVISQTYKLAGRGQFKCQTCGRLTSALGLDSRELLWKEQPETWRTMMVERLKDKDTKTRAKLMKEVDKVKIK